MVKTYINTYGMNDYTVKYLVEKLLGRSEFKAKEPSTRFAADGTRGYEELI